MTPRIKSIYWSLATVVIIAVTVAIAVRVTYPAYQDYIGTKKLLAVNSTGHFLQLKALRYGWDDESSQFPADLREVVSPADWPVNAYTGAPMKNVEFGAADRFGNFTYYPAATLRFTWFDPDRSVSAGEPFVTADGHLWPREIERRPRGAFYLILYGPPDYPGADLDFDGQPDNVLKVLDCGTDTKFPTQSQNQSLAMVMQERGIELGPLPEKEAACFSDWAKMQAWADELGRDNPRDANTWLADYQEQDYAEFELELELNSGEGSFVPAGAAIQP